MTTYAGNLGTVKLGANQVGEVIEWDINEEVDPIDDTAMGDAYHSHIPNSGIKKWSGNLTCHYDPGDTNGQVVIAVVGASVVLNLYPRGATTGFKYYTGTATVTKRPITVKMDDETIRQSFEFLGSGPLTLSTVP